jgi:cell division topological specificity factor
MHDRLDLSPEKMEGMKREIWEVVSRYMVVDDDFLEFEVRRLDELMVLVSNIEVKELDRQDPVPAVLEPAPAP